MILARLVFQGEGVGLVAQSIEPDNLPNMHLSAEEECLCLEFSTEKIGTLLSTVDDLLMNIKISEEIMVSAEER